MNASFLPLPRKQFQPRNLPKLATRLTTVGLDEVGSTLSASHGDELWSNPLVLEFLGERIEFLRSRYAGLNPGQVRMNVGNLIRNAIKRSSRSAS